MVDNPSRSTLANNGLAVEFNPDFALSDGVKDAADAAIDGIIDGSIDALP